MLNFCRKRNLLQSLLNRLLSHFRQAQPLSDDNKHQKQIERLVMEWICTGSYPFSFGKEAGLKRLNDCLSQGKATHRTEKFYRTNQLDKTFAEVRAKVRDLISKAEPGAISGTTDLWSQGEMSLMSLTALCL